MDTQERASRAGKGAPRTDAARPEGAAAEPPGRPAEIVLVGWHGVDRQRVEVVGETPRRYRIRALERTRLAGRERWLDPGRMALVPKRAVRFLEAEPRPAGGRRGAELER